MNHHQRWILGVAAGLLFILAVLLPWNQEYHAGGTHTVQPIGYALFFTPPKAKVLSPEGRRIESDSDEYSIVVSLPRVLIPMAGVAIAAAAAYVIAGQVQARSR